MCVLSGQNTYGTANERERVIELVKPEESKKKKKKIPGNNNNTKRRMAGRVFIVDFRGFYTRLMSTLKILLPILFIWRARFRHGLCAFILLHAA